MFGFSGLANNNIFKKHLAKSYRLTGFIGFKDHHVYTQKQLDSLVKKANGATLICTQKDWVKIKDLKINHTIEKVNMSHQIIESDKFDNWLVQQIES